MDGDKCWDALKKVVCESESCWLQPNRLTPKKFNILTDISICPTVTSLYKLLMAVLRMQLQWWDGWFLIQTVQEHFHSPQTHLIIAVLPMINSQLSEKFIMDSDLRKMDLSVGWKRLWEKYLMNIGCYYNLIFFMSKIYQAICQDQLSRKYLVFY